METYDGSGYIVDIDLNITMEEYRKQIAWILDPRSGYFNVTTRVHFITLNLYASSSDYFVCIDIMVEFAVSGLLVPKYFTALVFKANIFETEAEKFL